MSITNNLLTKFQGTWSSSVQYGFAPIQNTNQYSASLVRYGTPALSYYVNGTVQPTLALAPPSDPAWSVFSGGTTPNLAPVLVATTANITLSGEQTIDGVVTSTSRVLVNNQTLSQNNGIYTTGSGAWTRTSDANTWVALVGAVVAVEFGTTQAGFVYASNATPGGTIGTTAFAFNHVGSNVVTVATSGFVNGFSGTGISAGALTLNNGSNVVTPNLVVNATTISLPLNTSLNVIVVLDVTTADTSGATFTITGANCTATTQAIAVGASVTAEYITLLANVVTTSTAAPALSIVASALTGTVTINNDSVIQISQA